MTRLETFTLEIAKAYFGNPASPTYVRELAPKDEKLAVGFVHQAKLILAEIDKHDTKACPNCGKPGDRMDDHHYCQTCRESF